MFDPLHGGGGADEGYLVGFDRKGGFTQAAIFQYQMALFRGVPDRRDEPVRGIGLGQEIVGAVLHALHGGCDVAMPGDEDHRNVGIDIAHAPEQLQAVHVRHADVAYDYAVELTRQQRQRGARAGVRIHFDAVQLECLRVGAQQLLVIVDEHGSR